MTTDPGSAHEAVSPGEAFSRTYRRVRTRATSLAGHVLCRVSSLGHQPLTRLRQRGRVAYRPGNRPGLECLVEVVAHAVGGVGVKTADAGDLVAEALPGEDLGDAVLGPSSLVAVPQPVHGQARLDLEPAEWRAISLHIWEPLLIPGLLQTPDYARALFKAWRSAGSDEELDARWLITDEGPL